MDTNSVNFLRRFEKDKYLSVGDHGYNVRGMEARLLKGIGEILLKNEPESVKLHFSQLFAAQQEDAANSCITVFIPDAVTDIKSVMAMSALPADKQAEVKRQIAYDFAYLSSKARIILEKRNPKPDLRRFCCFFYNPEFAGGLGAFLHLPDSDDNIFIVNGNIPVAALYGYRLNPFRSLGGAVPPADQQVAEAPVQDTDQDWRYHHPLEQFVPGNDDGAYKSCGYDWSDRVTPEDLVKPRDSAAAAAGSDDKAASDTPVPDAADPEPAKEAPPEEADFAKYAPGANGLQEETPPENDADKNPPPEDTVVFNDTFNDTLNSTSDTETAEKSDTGLPPFVKWLLIVVLIALAIIILIALLWFFMNPGKPLSAMLPWQREIPAVTETRGSGDTEVPVISGGGSGDGVIVDTGEIVSGKVISGEVTGVGEGVSSGSAGSPDGDPGSPDSPASGTAAPGTDPASSDPGRDPALYNAEFDSAGSGAGEGDSGSLAPNVGSDGDLLKPESGSAADFKETGSGSETAGTESGSGSPEGQSAAVMPSDGGAYLKISYRDLGAEPNGDRRVGYTVTDEKNSVRCSLRGKLSKWEQGRVFFIDKNARVGNGCDPADFPREMICHDSDGQFCRVVPQEGARKGYIQYVKLSEEKP